MKNLSSFHPRFYLLHKSIKPKSFKFTKLPSGHPLIQVKRVIFTTEPAGAGFWEISGIDSQPKSFLKARLEDRIASSHNDL